MFPLTCGQGLSCNEKYHSNFGMVFRFLSYFSRSWKIMPKTLRNGWEIFRKMFVEFFERLWRGAGEGRGGNGGGETFRKTFEKFFAKW